MCTTLVAGQTCSSSRQGQWVRLHRCLIQNNAFNFTTVKRIPADIHSARGRRPSSILIYRTRVSVGRREQPHTGKEEQVYTMVSSLEPIVTGITDVYTSQHITRSKSKRTCPRADKASSIYTEYTRNARFHDRASRPNTSIIRQCQSCCA